MDNETSQRRRLLRILFTVTSLAVLCVAAAVVLAVLNFGAPSSGGADGGHLETIIKDNVVIYDEETSPFKILASDETSVTVSDIAGINEDSILSAGVTEATPYGLLRRINSITPTDDGYVIATEQAALTDAIEQCDVEFTVTIDEDGNYEVTLPNDPEVQTLIEQAYADEASVDATRDGSSWGLSGNYTSDEGWSTDAYIEGDDTGLTVGFFHEGEVEDTPFIVGVGAEINGHIVIDPFPFAENLIDFEMTFDLKGQLSIQDVFEVDVQDKRIWSKMLRPIVLEVGIPIVLAPELAVDLSANGSIGVGEPPFMALMIGKTLGFRYTSSDGMQPINIDYSKWGDITTLARANYEAELDFSIGIYLYGVAGPQISTGIASDIDASLTVVSKSESADVAFEVPWSDQKLSGFCNLKVYVPISGRFIVDIPNPFNFFDGSLVEIDVELFNTEDAITLVDVSLGTPPDELSGADEAASAPAGTGDESTGALQELPDGRTVFTTPRSGAVPQFSFECPPGWRARGMVYPSDDDESDYAAYLRSDVDYMGFRDEGTVLAFAIVDDVPVVMFFCKPLSADGPVGDDVSVDATEVPQTGEIATSGAPGSGFESWAVADITFLNLVTGSEEQRFQLVPKSVIGNPTPGDIVVETQPSGFTLVSCKYQGYLLGFYAQNVAGYDPWQKEVVISVLSSLRVVG